MCHDVRSINDKRKKERADGGVKGREMKKVPLFSGCGFQNEGLRQQESHLSRRFSVTVGTTVYSIFFYASSSVWDGLLTTSAFFFYMKVYLAKR